MRLLSLSLLTLGLTLLGGCQVSERTHGKSGVLASYNGFELRADLPGGTSVESVIAAAESSFRDQGYTIVTSGATSEYGSVVARPPRTADYPRVKLVAKQGDGVTRVYVNKEPFNEEALCRGVLSRTLEKLGL